MKYSSIERSRNLFLGEDWSEVVRIDFSIVVISLFSVDVPLSN